jgi:murein L,D-transpeptidase YafK
LFLSILTCSFAVFFASGAHAIKQRGENLPARFLDQGYVPRSIISIGADKNPMPVIIVEKASQQIFVLVYGRTMKITHTFPCSTGINKGNKKESGDQRTPVGVYFFTKKFSHKDLAPIYGSLAFPIDYPNFLDTLEGRVGNSIWVHGTNKPLKPRDSNGCIVMNNDDIQTLSRYITLNRTPVLIKDKIEWVPTDHISGEKEELLSFLNGWGHAFEQNNRNLYRSYYKKEEATVHGPLWDKWEILQKKWAYDIRRFDFHFKDLFLLRQGDAVIALFDEIVTLFENSLVAGTKKLYLTKHHNRWKIIGEVCQLPTNNKRLDPRLAALEKLDQFSDEHLAITELIRGWIAAWSEKDLERYISYYASDFRSKNMNRSAWKQYKGGLNELYGPITITFQDLQIKPKGANKRVVTFRQTYRASKSNVSHGYEAVGIKRLFLKRVISDWKIYRETWEEL